MMGARLGVSAAMRACLGVFAALIGNRLTALGVASLVVASAAFAAVVPSAVPGLSATSYTPATASQRLPQNYLFSVLGQKLYGSTGTEIGQIVEVLVAGSGRPRAVVVDVGGFLGLGTEKVAIDWQALQFYGIDGQKTVFADLSPKQLAGAPKYDPAARSVAVVSPRDRGYDP
jgi:hypothetical protein